MKTVSGQQGRLRTNDRNGGKIFIPIGRSEDGDLMATLKTTVSGNSIKNEDDALEEFFRCHNEHCGGRHLLAEQVITEARARKTGGLWVITYTVDGRVLRRAEERCARKMRGGV